MELGIGIVTGDAILEGIGSQDRQVFTMVGANAKLCARFCLDRV